VSGLLRKKGRKGGRDSRSVSQFYPSIILVFVPHTYLLAQGRIENTVITKHFPQPHGATKDAAKRHVFTENNLCF